MAPLLVVWDTVVWVTVVWVTVVWVTVVWAMVVWDMVVPGPGCLQHCGSDVGYCPGLGVPVILYRLHYYVI